MTLHKLTRFAQCPITGSTCAFCTYQETDESRWTGYFCGQATKVTPRIDKLEGCPKQQK